MKTPHLTSLLAAATLFLVLGAAARAQDAAPPPPVPPAGDWHARMLKEFDRNNDGVLDAAEKAAARARFEGMRGKRMAQGPRGHRGPGFAGRHDDRRDPEFRRGYLLGKYDRNGDGRLDETERNALRADMAGKLRRHMERQLARLKAIDTDGDGKISDAEWTAARTKFRGGMHGPHHRPGPGHDAAAPDSPPPPPTA